MATVVQSAARTPVTRMAWRKDRPGKPSLRPRSVGRAAGSGRGCAARQAARSAAADAAAAASWLAGRNAGADETGEQPLRRKARFR